MNGQTNPVKDVEFPPRLWHWEFKNQEGDVIDDGVHTEDFKLDHHVPYLSLSEHHAIVADIVADKEKRIAKLEAQLNHRVGQGLELSSALKQLTEAKAQITELEQATADQFENGIIFITEDAAKRLTAAKHSLAANMIRRCAVNYLGQEKFDKLSASGLVNE